LVAEIQAFREQFPSVGEVTFYDDNFMAAPTRVIEDFARLYKERVGLPFYCNFSPVVINERRLEALLDAGLNRIGMGIETGSERTQQLYTRAIDNQAILKATHLLHRYADRMLPPVYDVITDNPYEGIQDQLETLRLLWQIPRPYRLGIFSLVFYPGTVLYQRAIADGLIHDEREQIRNRALVKLQPTFYNLVVFGFHREFPRWLLWMWSRPLLFRFLSSPLWSPLWRAAHWVLARLREWYSSRRLRRFRRGTAGLAQPD
jgi:radical SAM superfamily enzyme YgiQ (UPF0313 family)